jgi:hypothetical protein
MSPEWRSRVVQSNRFGGDRWSARIVVQIRTLDEIIAEYGVLDFCKIDVEGYEEQVLGGSRGSFPRYRLNSRPSSRGLLRHVSIASATSWFRLLQCLLRRVDDFRWGLDGCAGCCAPSCKSQERCSSDLPWRLVVAKALSDSKEVGR